MTMIAEALLMATTVWYIPGWMRTEKPREDVMAAMTNAFPGAKVEFKAWDGDRLVWPHAVESADKESWRFAFEAAMMPQALPTIEGVVMDAGIWWDTLAETNGWKLQRNKVTGHGRIIDPQKVRKAWGSVEEMVRSFEKVRNQL